MKVRQARKIKVLSSVLLAAGLATACGDKDDDKEKKEDVIVQEDEATRNERLDKTQSDVPFTPAENANLLALDVFTAVQVAALAPPAVSGTAVQANDLAVSGLAVYIAYNSAGDRLAGGIDVLDVTNVLSLSILSSLQFTDRDINGVERQGSNLYITGASGVTEKAFLSKIALSGSLLTPSVTEYDLASYAGTDIASNASKLYVTSGDAGGLTVFDIATMAQTKYSAIADARAVSLTAAGAPIVLSGQPGKVTLANAAGDITSSVSLGGASIAQSKSSLKTGSQWSAVSLGEGGFKIVCNADGSTIASVPAIVQAGIDPSRTITNAVTANGGLIYSADGESGVHVYAVRDAAGGSGCGAATVSLLGSLNMGTDSSPNGIYSNGAFLYVATGLGGLKILTTVFTTLSPVTTKL